MKSVFGPTPLKRQWNADVASSSRGSCVFIAATRLCSPSSNLFDVTAASEFAKSRRCSSVRPKRGSRFENSSSTELSSPPESYLLRSCEPSENSTCYPWFGVFLGPSYFASIPACDDAFLYFSSGLIQVIAGFCGFENRDTIIRRWFVP